MVLTKIWRKHHDSDCSFDMKIRASRFHYDNEDMMYVVVMVFDTMMLFLVDEVGDEVALRSRLICLAMTHW